MQEREKNAMRVRYFAVTCFGNSPQGDQGLP